MDKKVAIGLGVLAAIGIYVWYQKNQTAMKTQIVTSTVPMMPPLTPPGPGYSPTPTMPQVVPQNATPFGVPVATPGTIYTTVAPAATMFAEVFTPPQPYRTPN